jgi:hypothetical protein
VARTAPCKEELRRPTARKNIDIDERGEILDGDTMLLLFNADHGDTVHFHLPLPDNDHEHSWELILDTAKDDGGDPKPFSDQFELAPCSMAVFRSKSSTKPQAR